MASEWGGRTSVPWATSGRSSISSTNTLPFSGRPGPYAFLGRAFGSRVLRPSTSRSANEPSCFAVSGSASDVAGAGRGRLPTRSRWGKRPRGRRVLPAAHVRTAATRPRPPAGRAADQAAGRTVHTAPRVPRPRHRAPVPLRRSVRIRLHHRPFAWGRCRVPAPCRRPTAYRHAQHRLRNGQSLHCQLGFG